MANISKALAVAVFGLKFLVGILGVLALALPAYPQIKTPTSGTVVTISGTAGGTPVNILIYDSQIHSGVVGQVPLVPCTLADQVFKTDAFVLQGGSPTGCNAVDLYEITDVATSTSTFTPRTDNNTHQFPGATDITKSAGLGSPLLPGTGFHIETHFICVGKCATGVTTKEKTFCNTAGTICINVVNGIPADDGFVVVTNNTGSNFTGAITLQGTSTAGCGASDTSTNLASGASVTLAMGNPGTAAAPNTLDSSNCGGFNFDQLSAPQPLPPSAPQPVTFLFGKDKFTMTPSTINGGDILTFRPVPMPDSLFNLPGSTLTNSTLGNGQKCVSVADFAGNLNGGPANIRWPVCPEFQTHCLSNRAGFNTNGTCNDAESFIWKGELVARLDQNAGYPTDPITGLAEIGGVHLLGAPGLNCPQNAFSDDIVLSYIGDANIDYTLPIGSTKGNCFVNTFDPTLAQTNPVAPGVQVFAVNGFFSPQSPPPTINPINGGQNVGLPFFAADGAGGPGVTNLSWCQPGPSAGNPAVCSDGTTPAPWVAVLRTPLSVPRCTGAGSTSGFIGVDTNSFMQNLGGGNYKVNWATSNTESTTNNCFWLGLVFNSGAANTEMNEFQVTK